MFETLCVICNTKFPNATQAADHVLTHPPQGTRVAKLERRRRKAERNAKYWAYNGSTNR